MSRSATNVSIIGCDPTALEEVCRAFSVQRLWIFGSAARGELQPESDVDLLIEYLPNSRPGMVGMQDLEDRLSELFGGRRVDLVNPKFLNPRIREKVLSEALLQYEG